jgi:hypothetical protein
MLKKRKGVLAGWEAVTKGEVIFLTHLARFIHLGLESYD